MNLREILTSEDLKITAGFEVTNRCNLRCKYCYQDKTNTGELTSDNWTRIVNYLKSLFCNDHIQFKFSGGEVFCVENISDSIEEALKDNVGVTILTNGVHIPNKVYSLLPSDNCYIEISLDGVREQHNKFRGGYDQTMDSLKRIAELKKQIAIRTSVYSENEAQLEMMIDHLMTALPQTDLTFHFQPLFENSKDYAVDILDLSRYAQIGKRVKNARPEAKQKWRLLDSRVFNREHKQLVSRNSELFGCAVGAYVLIKPDGNFSGCEFQETFGIITNYLDNPEEFLQLITKANSPDPRCTSCETLTACGGCRLQPLAHKYTETLNFNDCKEYVSSLIDIRKNSI